MGNFDLNSGLSPPSAEWQFSLTSPAMKSLSRVFAHILATIAKVLTIGGAKAVLGELIFVARIHTIRRHEFIYHLF